MNIAVAATGVSFGMVDMGIQSLILKGWGEKESRKLIQIFHATFAMGGLLAPLIAQSFMYQSEKEELPKSCETNTTSSQLEELRNKRLLLY